MKKSLQAILWTALVCVACSEKEEPAGNSPVVHTVRVEASSLEIPSGESVSLPFVVEDKDATFHEVKLLRKEACIKPSSRMPGRGRTMT